MPAYTPMRRWLGRRYHLINQIGQAAGGPLAYKGKTMQLAHQG